MRLKRRQPGFFDIEERTKKLTQMGGQVVRTIWILRARVKIGMMNLVYNRVRLGQLIRRDSEAAYAVR